MTVNVLNQNVNFKIKGIGLQHVEEVTQEVYVSAITILCVNHSFSLAWTSSPRIQN